MTRRLSVCFAAPGHTLLSTAGSTRNILATASALSEWADVTLAFRNVAEPLTSADFRVETIAAPQSGDAARDDVAIRGLNPLSHYSYLNSLRSYASCNAERFDVIFEKGWRFSGFLAHAFRKHGVEAILIENDARFWTDPVRDLRGALKYVAHFTAQQLAGYCSRRVDVVVAETEQLKSALIAGRGLRPERIEVVPLGVDHAVFRPRDSAAARAELGISPAASIMLYVGGIDQWGAGVCQPDVPAIVKAIRYAVDQVGVAHVGLGSDFDGATRMPFDATGLPQLTEGLMAAGFNAGDIRAIMGGNVQRLLLQTLPTI